jgi:serine protease Do
MSALTEAGEAVNRIAGQIGPAVVGLGRGWGRGSGVVIDDGLVLTNAHNLRSDEAVVALPEGGRARGEVVGADGHIDVAVVSVETGGIEAVQWGEPSAVAIGTPVVALSNPGGRGLRATLGFASSAGRSFRGPRGRRVEGAIEHTAPLPRGSSGGPLVDLDGKLLGLNSLRLEGGLILAVPASARVRRRIEQITRGDAAETPRLGVAVAPPRVARRMRRAVGLPERTGLLVRGVEEDSPAAAAGIERGDLLARAGERELDSVDALYAELDAAAQSGTLELTVVRGTEERVVTADITTER